MTGLQAVACLSWALKTYEKEVAVPQQRHALSQGLPDGLGRTTGGFEVEPPGGSGDESFNENNNNNNSPRLLPLTLGHLEIAPSGCRLPARVANNLTQLRLFASTHGLPASSSDTHCQSWYKYVCGFASGLTSQRATAVFHCFFRPLSC